MPHRNLSSFSYHADNLTMDPIYEDVVLANNRGAETLSASSEGIDRSVGYFQLALQKLTTLLQEGPSPSQSEEEQQPADACTSSTTFANLAATTMHAGCAAEHVVDNAYLRGIWLIPSMNAYSEDLLINLAVAYGIVLFNFAIAFHSQAQCSQQSASNRTATVLAFRARSFYLKTQHVLQDFASRCTSCHGNEVVRLLTMAVYNNLGQISYFLNDYAESEYYFQRLVIYAYEDTFSPTSNQEATQHDIVSATILNSYKSAFLTNALVLQPPEVAPAA